MTSWRCWAAVGSERAAVLGHSEGGSLAVLYAATYPERVTALVTTGIFAKREWSPDYPWAEKPEERQGYVDALSGTGARTPTSIGLRPALHATRSSRGGSPPISDKAPVPAMRPRCCG